MEEWFEMYFFFVYLFICCCMYLYFIMFDMIDYFVLFDLFGNKYFFIRSFFREMDWLFDCMVNGDERLREEGLVEVEKGEDGWFRIERGRKGMVGDDYVFVS